MRRPFSTSPAATPGASLSLFKFIDLSLASTLNLFLSFQGFCLKFSQSCFLAGIRMVLCVQLPQRGDPTPGRRVGEPALLGQQWPGVSSASLFSVPTAQPPLWTQAPVAVLGGRLVEAQTSSGPGSEAGPAWGSILHRCCFGRKLGARFKQGHF